MRAMQTKWRFGSLLFAVGMLGVGHLSIADDVKTRILAQGELAPLPEAQPLLVKLAEVIDSIDLKTAIGSSETLVMLRERVRTSLFHLNFVFEVPENDYPYDPPFNAPFPFRPTLEAMDEVYHFLKLVESMTAFKSDLTEQIPKFSHFADLKSLFPEPKPQGVVQAISKQEIALNPVDSYVTFMERKDQFGESASFPEYAPAVEGLLQELKSEEMSALRAKDKAFNEVCGRAIAELQEVQNPEGAPERRLYGRHTGAYPYRKTIQALDYATIVVDLRDRLKYPEGINWHDVELSWFVGGSPKVLPLYHFNRYKYQMAGLLADHEMVLLENWGGASFEYLDRIRVAPLGLLQNSTETARIDRHHNTPADDKYHDGNHVRRLWGYDRRKARARGAVTRAQRIAIYREQDAFMKALLDETNPAAVAKEDSYERNLRKYERLIIFECFHETALTPDKESLIRDILRVPATPQPFEVQVQFPIHNLEDIRAFDGNLKSGADQLHLNMSQATTIRFFYDRAPGFLANVDNKVRWGFFDSSFDPQKYMPDLGYRTPVMLATAAIRLLKRLGYASPPSIETLVKQIIDHSGQPELWNYFSLKDLPVVRKSKLNPLYVAAADEIHAAWRRNSKYEERWKPTNAKLRDGTIVNDEWSKAQYLKELEVPEYLKAFYRLGKDPATGETILEEDIRNLPNKYLAKNHQGENLMSGAKAVIIVDRLWHKDLKFKSLDAVERWLVAAAQAVHQAVLDRNANGARNNPVYNVHWLLLPPENQINDLELVRIGVEAHMKHGTKKLSPETVTIFQEALSRLYRKIRRDEPIRSCEFRSSKKRSEKVAARISKEK